MEIRRAASATLFFDLNVDSAIFSYPRGPSTFYFEPVDIAGSCRKNDSNDKIKRAAFTALLFKSLIKTNKHVCLMTCSFFRQ